MSEKSDAIVIRQTDFSESSRIVTFFTRDFGKLGMLAKGGRRQKNAFDSSLDLLAESSIVFIRKYNALSILTEASLKSRFRPAATDMSNLYAGYYIAELLDALTEDGDPHEELYDDAVAGLQTLSVGENRFLAVSRFEVRILTEIGQCPTFDACLKCGHEVEPGDTAGYVHWVSQGGLLCAQCRNESYASTRISPGSFAVLRRLADADDVAIDRVVLTRGQVGEIRSVLNQAISHVLERRPKMTRYLTF